MSDIAIRVENLSKLYKFGARRNRHDTLRDHITNAFKGVFSRNGNAASHRGHGSQGPDTFWALKDVSFEIKHGEVVGIIGRNGAGKSTLLKILSRITEPTEGRAIIYGRVGSLLEVGTGFHGELSGRENIYLNGAILGMKKAEIERKFDEIVDFAEIEKFIDTPVKRYSSGMYVRLAFAVAAHLEPEILIVDEVLAVGDYAFQNKCLGKMGDVARQGRTVLFVSHNLGAVLSLTHQSIWMEQGTLAMHGTTGNVCTAYMNSLRSTGVERGTWTAPSATQNPIQVLRAELSSPNSKEVVSDFTPASEIQINIDYVVRQVVKGAVIAALLHAPDGALLISLEDADQNTELLLERRPGTYRASVTFPASSLNSGSYVVRICSGIPGEPDWDHVRALSFNLIETVSPITRNQYRKGYLIPLLKWDTRVLT